MNKSTISTVLVAVAAFISTSQCNAQNRGSGVDSRQTSNESFYGENGEDFSRDADDGVPVPIPVTNGDVHADSGPTDFWDVWDSIRTLFESSCPELKKAMDAARAKMDAARIALNQEMMDVNGSWPDFWSAHRKHELARQAFLAAQHEWRMKCD